MTDQTPGLVRSPKGQFDAQAALRALEAGDEESLVAALMTTKWGKSGYQAMVTIEEALDPGTEALYDWACRLADRPEPVARAIAAPLFRHYWPLRPNDVQARLFQLADDEDWWVREALLPPDCQVRRQGRGSFTSFRTSLAVHARQCGKTAERPRTDTMKARPGFPSALG